MKDESDNSKNAFIMNVLVILGVIVLCSILLYLMNYFFVKKNDLKINMSTDKKVEYITINNKEELITTQKYVSDLGYTMRYDINNFSIFKYKGQDYFKNIQAEKILVIVEKGSIPGNCSNTDVSNYDSCIIKLDNYTKQYYMTENNKTYKITVKTPNINEYEQNINSRINYMLNSFEIKDSKENV